MKYILTFSLSLLLGMSVSAQMMVGGHSGGGYASGGEQPAQVTPVDLKVFLQGPFNGTNMNTGLATLSIIPTTQVFGSDPLAPWYYAGTEEIDAAADLSNTVNWVLLELRTTSGAPGTANSSTMKDQQPALLQNDGSIMALDAESIVRFNYEDNDDVYVVVWSNNHLPVMNAAPMTKTGDAYLYDFTDSPSKAWSKTGISTPPMKTLGGGMYGLYAGDCNPDTLVYYSGTGNDRDEIYSEVGGATLSAVVDGYSINDLNMDGKTRYMGKANDKIVIYNALDGNVNDTLRAHIP
jgi:hypothetical protein